MLHSNFNYKDLTTVLHKKSTETSAVTLFVTFWPVVFWAKLFPRPLLWPPGRRSLPSLDEFTFQMLCAFPPSSPTSAASAASSPPPPAPRPLRVRTPWGSCGRGKHQGPRVEGRLQQGRVRMLGPAPPILEMRCNGGCCQGVRRNAEEGPCCVEHDGCWVRERWE